MTDQPSLFPSSILSVAQVNEYVRLLLEGDEFLQDLWVSGEISNLSRPRSGHVYFILKDSASSLRCVAWRPVAMRLPASLRDGMAVEVHGSIGVYEREGQYQLYIDILRPAGEGALFQEFMRLKARLEAEGLFDPQHKRLLPARPKTIGIVTSPTAAALQDVLNTLRQRYPFAQVYLSPTAVQGDPAPPQIVAALEHLNAVVHPDVILLVRGGGSLEDLWAFNDERVVRAVYASQAPVITGVGHETDFTLVDFAADQRAPTPTAAAVQATPELSELKAELQVLGQDLKDSLSEQLAGLRRYLAELNMRLNHMSPLWRIQNGCQHVDGLQERLLRAGQTIINLQKMKLHMLDSRLRTLNPLSVLDRGFALVSKPDGNLVRSVQQIQSGDLVNVRLADGTFGANISQVQRGMKEE